MESVAQMQENFLELFARNLAKLKYGSGLLVHEQPYQKLLFSDLKRDIVGMRVEVNGYVGDISPWPTTEGHLSYQGSIYEGDLSLRFERVGYTVYGDTFKCPATIFEQPPFTNEQLNLELRALSGFEGVVSMRGKLQKREGSPLLLVERIVDFKEKYQQDAA